MSENIGYEIPPSLKYEERIFAGLTRRQVIYLLCAVCFCAAIIRFTTAFAVYGSVYKVALIMTLCAVITFFGAVCVLRLDSWFLTVIKYVKRKNKINRFDNEMLDFLSLRNIEYNHFYNVFGDACTILKLYTLTENRSNSTKTNDMRQADVDFLNSLPCSIQILGYSSVFDIEKYTSTVLSGITLLPDDLQKLMIGHLNHIEQYCNDANIKEKTLYMVIRTPVNALNQIERLNIDTNTIVNGLASCSVIGERLEGKSLTNTLLMISCGVGRDGIDYLSGCVTMED